MLVTDNATLCAVLLAPTSSLCSYFRQMSRVTACLILLVVWALIYLPTWGRPSFAVKKVTVFCRRCTFSIGGSFCVPYIAARPYFNKPPLINWLVAASFKLSGIRNEWTSRLPSALFILAAALTLATLGRSSLGPIGSFIAALCWLTNLGLMKRDE